MSIVIRDSYLQDFILKTAILKRITWGFCSLKHEQEFFEKDDACKDKHKEIVNAWEHF